MKRAGDGDESQQQLGVMPTLEQVAEEEDFAPLRELLKAVAKRPVDQLSDDVRAALLRRVGDDQDGDLLLRSFFAACDAAVRAAEQRKRARSGGGGEGE